VKNQITYKTFPEGWFSLYVSCFISMIGVIHLEYMFQV